MGLESKQVLKIGIIAPRTHHCGGHDIFSDYRKELRYQISKVVEPLIDLDRPIIGITGLSIGPEQDFAIVCKQLNVDYTVYLPFEDQENLWSKLHKNIAADYKVLLNNAFQVITLNSHKYSPKKNLIKKQRIIKESDIILYINYPLDNSKTLFLDKAKDLGKKVIEINV